MSSPARSPEAEPMPRRGSTTLSLASDDSRGRSHSASATHRMRFALRRAKSIDDGDALFGASSPQTVSAASAATAAAAAASAANAAGQAGWLGSGTAHARPYSSSKASRPLSRSSNTSSLQAPFRRSLTSSPRHSDTGDASMISDLIFQSGLRIEDDGTQSSVSPTGRFSPNGRFSPLARRRQDRLSTSPTILQGVSITPEPTSPRPSTTAGDLSSLSMASLALSRPGSARFSATQSLSAAAAATNATTPLQRSPARSPILSRARRISDENLLVVEPLSRNTSSPPSTVASTTTPLIKIADTFNAAPPERRRRQSAIMDVSQMREALQVLGAIESAPPSRAASPDRKSPTSSKLPSTTPSFFQLARDAQEARRLGKFEQSIVLYRRALATGTNSVELKKAALINLALSMEGMGDLKAAEAQFEVALSFCREVDDLQGQAEVHSHLGVLMEKVSRYAEAKQQHTRAFTIFHERLADGRGQSIAASNLGSLSSAMGRPRDALKWHLLALEALTRAVDSKPSPEDYSTCYSHIGMLYYELGDIAQATVYYVRDYEVCAALGADLATTVAAGKRLVSLLLAGDGLEEALARLEHLGELVTATSDRLHEEYIRLRDNFEEAPPAAPHDYSTNENDSVQAEAGQRQSVDDALVLLEEAEALQVEILVEAGLLFSVAQQWAKAEAAYEQVLTILEEYEDLRSHTSDVLMRLGQIALNRGRPEEAANHFKRELELRYAEDDLAGHAVALCNYGHCLALNEEFGQAAIIQEQAYILFKDVLGDLQGQARAYSELGAAFANTGAFDSALTAFLKVLDIMKDINDDPEGMLHALLHVGEAYCNVGDADKAAEYLTLCIEKCEGQAFPQTEVKAYRLLGVVFDQTGNPVEALEALRTALHLAMEEDTCDQSKVICLLSLGQFHLKRAAAIPALSCFERVIAHLALVSENTHDDLSKAEAHSGAAEAFVIMEDFESALQHYNLYIKSLTDFESERHDLLSIALVNRATVLLQLGCYEEAAESVQEAIGLEDEPNLDSWQHAYQQGLLGISLRNMGELEGAYKAFHVAEVFYEQVVKEEEEAILDRACNLRSLSLVCHHLHKPEEAQLWKNFLHDTIDSWPEYVRASLQDVDRGKLMSGMRRTNAGEQFLGRSSTIDEDDEWPFDETDGAISADPDALNSAAG